MDAANLPRWVPDDLREWMRSVARPETFIDPIVVTDARMQMVWAWHRNCQWNSEGVPLGRYKTQTSSLAFCMDINSAKKMPGKPGNLPPKQRAAYLQKVRTHARALLSLLQDTQYDVHDRGRKLDLEDPHLPETLVQNLASWGDDETGHVVAYLVDEDGVYDAPWDYPDCYLADQLSDLIAWTFNSDYFDRGMRSSAPIAHANAGNTRIIYFNCSLYERVRRSGGTIPFPVLATVANVALRLPPENCVDEDTVRKQVRRYEERRANQPEKRQLAFADDAPPGIRDEATEGDPF